MRTIRTLLLLTCFATAACSKPAPAPPVAPPEAPTPTPAATAPEDLDSAAPKATEDTAEAPPAPPTEAPAAAADAQVEPVADAPPPCLLDHVYGGVVTPARATTWAGVLRELEPKRAGEWDDAGAQEVLCNYRDEHCAATEAVSVVAYDGASYEAIVLRHDGGYAIFKEPWPYFGERVDHAITALGDQWHVAATHESTERVPFCPNGEEDESDCGTATALVGTEHYDLVLDPASGRLLWWANCSTGEDVTDQAPVVTRNGEEYGYTGCEDGAQEQRFTLARAAGCLPAPEEAAAPSADTQVADAPPTAVADPAAVARLIAAGRKATTGKDYPAAVTSFTEAITLDGAASRAWSGRGYAKLMSGDLAGARSDLEAALKAAPGAAEARFRGTVLFNLGLVAEKQGDKAAAKAAYTSSLAEHPSPVVKKKLDKLDD